MSDTILTTLISVLASIIVVFLSKYLTDYISKKKLPLELKDMGAKTDLTQSELIEKYLTIASKQGDANLALQKQLEGKEDEKEELKAEIENLRQEMIELDNKHKTEIESLKTDFDVCRKDNDKWREWSVRLVYQLKSFNILPTPFDIEKAKKEGLSLGEYGPKKLDES